MIAKNYFDFKALRAKNTSIVSTLALFQAIICILQTQPCSAGKIGISNRGKCATC